MEKFNLDFGTGEGKPLGRISGLGVPRQITANKLKNWVNNSGLDDYTKKELIKKIESYPANTSHHFYKNINEHIRRIHAEKRRIEKDKEK